MTAVSRASPVISASVAVVTAPGRVCVGCLKQSHDKQYRRVLVGTVPSYFCDRCWELAEGVQADLSMTPGFCAQARDEGNRDACK